MSGPRSWRGPLALCGALTLAALNGCAGSRARTPAPTLVPTSQPVQSDRFDLDINIYVNLAPTDPRRAALGQTLHRQIAQAIDEALARSNVEQAKVALQTLGLMYLPRDLDTPISAPVLAKSVEQLYEKSARRGDEHAAVLAYAVIEFLGSKAQKARLHKGWPDFLAWLKIIPDGSDRPAFASPMRLILQTSLAYWPSPWTADRLRASYQQEIDHILATRSAHKDPAKLKAANETLGQLYYWKIRVDLRRADLKSALAQIKAIQTQSPDIYPQFAAFEELFARASKPGNTSAMLELLEKLDPTPLDAPDWILHDAWSTVQALASDLVWRAKANAQAHLFNARSLRGLSLTLASIPHYERALATFDTQEVWTELAMAHAHSLETEARYDIKRAQKHLKQIETFYTNADKRFGEGKIQPGLNDARLRIVHALFEAGEIDQTQALCEEMLKQDPRPETLQLLATIAMHRGEFAKSGELISRMLKLSFADPMEQRRWVIIAELLDANRQIVQGRTQEAAQSHAKLAAKDLDALLDLPGVDAATRAELFMQRFEARMIDGDPTGAFFDVQQALRTRPEDATIYLRAMSEYWLFDRIADARPIFHRALAQHSLDPIETVYLALWLLDLGQRHKDADAIAEAKAILRQHQGNAWTQKLAAFALGKRSSSELLKAANNKTQRTEAQFYIGLSLDQEGKRQAAKDAFATVLQSEMMGLVEYRMAKLALHRAALGKPGHPKAPATGEPVQDPGSPQDKAQPPAKRPHSRR